MPKKYLKKNKHFPLQTHFAYLHNKCQRYLKAKESVTHHTSTIPCLLRDASAISHHHTTRMTLKSVIFCTPKSGKIIHIYIQNTHQKYI